MAQNSNEKFDRRMGFLDLFGPGIDPGVPQNPKPSFAASSKSVARLM